MNHFVLLPLILSKSHIRTLCSWFRLFQDWSILLTQRIFLSKREQRINWKLLDLLTNSVGIIIHTSIRDDLGPNTLQGSSVCGLWFWLGSPKKPWKFRQKSAQTVHYRLQVEFRNRLVHLFFFSNHKGFLHYEILYIIN